MNDEKYHINYELTATRGQLDRLFATVLELKAEMGLLPEDFEGPLGFSSWEEDDFRNMRHYAYHEADMRAVISGAMTEDEYRRNHVTDMGVDAIIEQAPDGTYSIHMVSDELDYEVTGTGSTIEEAHKSFIKNYADTNLLYFRNGKRFVSATFYYTLNGERYSPKEHGLGVRC